MVAADFLDGDLDLVKYFVLGGFVASGGSDGLEFLVDLEETTCGTSDLLSCAPGRANDNDFVGNQTRSVTMSYVELAGVAQREGRVMLAWSRTYRIMSSAIYRNTSHVNKSVAISDKGSVVVG